MPTHQHGVRGLSIVITGAGSGIGRALAQGFLRDGARVVAADIREEGLAELKGAGALTQRCDVSRRPEVKALIEAAKRETGRVDVLFNNAGYGSRKRVSELEEGEFERLVAVHLFGTIYGMRFALPIMREQGFGRIINISSINGQTGQFGQVNYGAAKAGLLGFTKALAAESASKGITVHAVAPGYLATEMVAAMSVKVKDFLVERIPVGRLGEADETARCVVFLASDNAAFITGSTLSVNGGQHVS